MTFGAPCGAGATTWLAVLDHVMESGIAAEQAVGVIALEKPASRLCPKCRD